MIRWYFVDISPAFVVVSTLLVHIKGNSADDSSRLRRHLVDNNRHVKIADLATGETPSTVVVASSLSEVQDAGRS